jgi:hypothetical protein
MPTRPRPTQSRPQQNERLPTVRAVRRRRLFTRHDVWLGSFYELAIELGPRSDERLAAASAALWRHPALEGPYRDHTREPWEQEIVSPSLVVSSDVVMHLYGAATLPDGHQVAAGSVAVREDESGIDWLDLYTPLGALETIYDIGYPYDESWRVWAEPLVRWFADIGRWIYHEVAFRRELIGEEVTRVPARSRPPGYPTSARRRDRSQRVQRTRLVPDHGLVARLSPLVPALTTPTTERSKPASQVRDDRIGGSARSVQHDAAQDRQMWARSPVSQPPHLR